MEIEVLRCNNRLKVMTLEGDPEMAKKFRNLQKRQKREKLLTQLKKDFRKWFFFE